MSGAQGLWLVFVAWGAAEAVLGVFKRAGGASADVRDRGSMAVVWATIGISCFVGASLASTRPAPIGLDPGVGAAIGLGALIAGIALRVYAIVTLGRFFTTNVALHAGHVLVRRGLYRTLRHPSYTGLLLAFFGVGFGLGDWLGLAVIVLPITGSLLYRIRVEETALAARFGAEYAAYRATSKKLIPGIY